MIGMNPRGVFTSDGFKGPSAIPPQWVFFTPYLGHTPWPFCCFGLGIWSHWQSRHALPPNQENDFCGIERWAFPAQHALCKLLPNTTTAPYSFGFQQTGSAPFGTKMEETHLWNRAEFSAWINLGCCCKLRLFTDSKAHTLQNPYRPCTVNKIIFSASWKALHYSCLSFLKVRRCDLFAFIAALSAATAAQHLLTYSKDVLSMESPVSESRASLVIVHVLIS